MLRLTVSTEEYLMINDNIKIVFNDHCHNILPPCIPAQIHLRQFCFYAAIPAVIYSN